MRQLLCILLLICLPLQSFASQSAGVRQPDAAGLRHVLDHAEDRHHHHEGDGSIHYDESDESVEHTCEGSPAPQQSLLNPAPALVCQLVISRADSPDLAAYLPLPYLEVPQRPPSFAPGLAAGG